MGSRLARPPVPTNLQSVDCSRWAEQSVRCTGRVASAGGVFYGAVCSVVSPPPRLTVLRSVLLTVPPPTRDRRPAGGLRRSRSRRPVHLRPNRPPPTESSAAVAASGRHHGARLSPHLRLTRLPPTKCLRPAASDSAFSLIFRLWAIPMGPKLQYPRSYLFLASAALLFPGFNRR